MSLSRKLIYLEPEKDKTSSFSWFPADIHIEMDGSVNISLYNNGLHLVYHDAFYLAPLKVLAKITNLL
ncbi:hypothetical protein BX070DRAFT_223992, partial [Coemansia spiralis]